MPELTVRLNKFIAQQLSIGRRQADEFIDRRKVLVNGKTAILGAQINPAKDKISVDGRPLETEATTFIYLALNKPIDYICSRRQQGETPTIYSLLPMKYHHLKPIGRLDKDSSGLLILTNDGDFAFSMTHPKFHKTKCYQVELSEDLQPDDYKKIALQGIDLPDGKSKLGLERMANDRCWKIVMHEGRNRQIRRTFGTLKYSVRSLHRTTFGNYNLNNLKPGDFVPVIKK